MAYRCIIKLLAIFTLAVAELIDLATPTMVNTIRGCNTFLIDLGNQSSHYLSITVSQEDFSVLLGVSLSEEEVQCSQTDVSAAIVDYESYFLEKTTHAISSPRRQLDAQHTYISSLIERRRQRILRVGLHVKL